MKFIKQIIKTAILSSVSVFFAFFSFVFTTVFAVMVLVAIVGGESDFDSDEPQYEHVFGAEDSERVFHSIPITGVIYGESLDADPFALSDMTFGYDIKKELYRLADEDDSAGVLLEIHSPGGTIYGTQAIVDGVKYYKEKTGNSVVAYIGSVAASGGYWAASAADMIFADAGTSIGSIGVIQGPFKFYDSVLKEDYGAFIGSVETANGIETEFITSGTSKDLGNPHRQLRDDERAVLQQGADQAYLAFVKQVAQARGISEAEITNSIGAFVYGEVQAKQLKLIDDIASKEAAYVFIAGPEMDDDEYQVVRQEKPLGVFESFIGVGSRWLGYSTKTNTTCRVQGSLLAYYGDVSVLCR